MRPASNLGPIADAEPRSDTQSLADPDWVHDRRWVLLFLFFGMGPLGLPVLWRSRAFTRRQKLLLTVVVFALTALVVALGWWSLKQLAEMFRLLRSA